MNLAEKIIANCVEEGGCLIWQGATNGEGSPAIWWEGCRQSLRRLIWTELHGYPPIGLRIGCSCGHKQCVEPACLRVSNLKDELKGRPKPMAHRMKIALARRSGSVITDDMVRLIRSSPKTAVALAAELGMKYQTVSKIRNHERRRDFSPFAGLTF